MIDLLNLMPLTQDHRLAKTKKGRGDRGRRGREWSHVSAVRKLWSLPL